MRSRIGFLALALAAVGALLAGAPAFVLSIRAWPEVVTGGYFIARGGSLYRTIFLPYTPLLLELVGGLGRLFGFSAFLLRSVVAGAAAATGFLLVIGLRRRRTGEGSILGLGIAVPLALLWDIYCDGPALWFDPFVSPLLLAMGLVLERYERHGDDRSLVLGGLLGGLALAVKQTVVWPVLAALAWLVLSRRGSWRSFITLSLSVAAPYLLLAALWTAQGGGLSFIRWTLIIVAFSNAGLAFQQLPGLSDCAELVAPLVVLPAVALLRLTLPVRRRLHSPIPWLIVGTLGMMWPRWGLLHLAGATGLIALWGGRGVVVALAVAKRMRHRSPRRSYLVAAAAGTALLLSHCAVAVLGAGWLAIDRVGGPVWYWDDKRTQTFTEHVRRWVPPGEALLVYKAPYETLYPLTGTTTPGEIYANPDLWWWLQHDDVDQRIVTSLILHPGALVLFRAPEQAEEKATRLYRFLIAHTELLAEFEEGVTMRRVIPDPQ